MSFDCQLFEQLNPTTSLSDVDLISGSWFFFVLVLLYKYNSAGPYLFRSNSTLCETF